MTLQEFKDVLPAITAYASKGVNSEEFTEVRYESPDMIFDEGLGKSVSKFGNSASNRDAEVAAKDLLKNLTNKGYDSVTKTFK